MGLFKGLSSGVNRSRPAHKLAQVVAGAVPIPSSYLTMPVYLHAKISFRKGY
jgi:hypothetical protein